MDTSVGDSSDGIKVEALQGLLSAREGSYQQWQLRRPRVPSTDSPPLSALAGVACRPSEPAHPQTSVLGETPRAPSPGTAPNAHELLC